MAKSFIKHFPSPLPPAAGPDVAAGPNGAGQDFLSLLNGSILEPMASPSALASSISLPPPATPAGSLSKRESSPEIAAPVSPGAVPLESPIHPNRRERARGAPVGSTPKRQRQVAASGGEAVSATTSSTSTEGPPAANPVAKTDPEASVRQTFVLGAHHLERLRDYVHARRAAGEYYYSQRQALEEAVDCLLAGQAPAAPRPPEVREREQQFRARVRAGRRGDSA